MVTNQDWVVIEISNLDICIIGAKFQLSLVPLETWYWLYKGGVYVLVLSH